MPTQFSFGETFINSMRYREQQDEQQRQMKLKLNEEMRQFNLLQGIRVDQQKTAEANLAEEIRHNKVLESQKGNVMPKSPYENEFNGMENGKPVRKAYNVLTGKMETLGDIPPKGSGSGSGNGSWNGNPNNVDTIKSFDAKITDILRKENTFVKLKGKGKYDVKKNKDKAYLNSKQEIYDQSLADNAEKNDWDAIDTEKKVLWNEIVGSMPDTAKEHLEIMKTETKNREEELDYIENTEMSDDDKYFIAILHRLKYKDPDAPTRKIKYQSKVDGNKYESAELREE